MSRLGWSSPLLYPPVGWVRPEPPELVTGSLVATIRGRAGAVGGLSGGGAGFARGHGPVFNGGGASARWTRAVRPMITHDSRAAMGRACVDAQERSGVQVALCLAPTRGAEPHAHALDILFELGIQTAAAVLIYIASKQAAAEIVTTAAASVPDARSHAALEAILPALETGDVATAVRDGLALLLP